MAWPLMHWDVCLKTTIWSPWELAVSPPCWTLSYLRRPAENRDMDKKKDCKRLLGNTRTHTHTQTHTFLDEFLQDKLSVDWGDENFLPPIRDGAD